MASAPQPQLPLFYNDLMPLNSRDHAGWKMRVADKAPWLAGQHAIPLTSDEFGQAQRNFPIVFSTGDNPLPLALMGLNEGVNTFVDADGILAEPVYVPAYIRRYPFMLARLTPEAEELSLCFDPTADTIGDFAEGRALFDADGQPSTDTQGLLQFCQNFEEAGLRTKAFIDELVKHDLLMDGEVSIALNDKPDQPFVYRGFQMVNQDKLRELPAEVAHEWTQNGLIGLIYAHLFSLELMQTIFGRQMQQGKIPEQQPVPAAG